jgi:hypothetical protein
LSAPRGPAVPRPPPALEHQRLLELAEEIPEEHVERFYQLAQQPLLGDHEARELAEFIRPLYASDNDIQWLRPPDDEDVLAVSRLLPALPDAAADPDRVISVGNDLPSLRIAGDGSGTGGFDPRDILRVFTVWQMKDRAGRVGTRGVGPLLARIRSCTAGGEGSPPARLHLIGHSYGCKVLLSAILASGNFEGQGQPIDSLLLLQPAVNHLCFAARLPAIGHADGYAAVLQRVRQPILSTFSSHDRPLAILPRGV